MPTKSQLKDALADAHRQLDDAQRRIATHDRSKRRRDDANISQGLIPIEYLVAPQFIETAHSNKAQVTINDPRVIAKLREANRPSTFDHLIRGNLSYDFRPNFGRVVSASGTAGTPGIFGGIR